jgi:dipeptidyl aminopeptidase/acylaminoacyl peptidase
MNKILPLLFLLFTTTLTAQKPALDQTVYDGWKSISSPVVSDDGKWVTYNINPQQGDGWLYIYNVSTGRKDSVSRATKAVFSPDNKYIVYNVIPSYTETRQAKKKKLKDDRMPKNELEIRILPGEEKTRIARVKSFSVAEKNSDWMAYLLEKKNGEKSTKSNGSDSTTLKQTIAPKKAKTPEPKGTEFVILNPVLKKEYRYQDVTEYVVSADGRTISFMQTIPDSSKIDNFIVSVFDADKETATLVFEGKGSAKKLSSDKSGNLVSFIYSSDTSKVKVHSLFLSRNLGKAAHIVDTATPAMPHNWSVSENSNITFSEDGMRLFFGTAPKAVREPVDTLLDEEKYKLDIWSWDDDQLQPMQKKQLDQEKKRTWQAVYLINKNRMVQLADTVIPSVRTMQKGGGPLALGTSDLNYRKSSSWDGGGLSDYYVINVETGAKTKVLNTSASRVALSPACKYLLYWDLDEKAWFTASVNGDSKKNLTSGLNIPFYDELNDVPDDPSPHGVAGWLDDQKHVLVYDRYDIWSLDLSGNETPVNLTGSYGRNNNLRLRYLKLDPDAEYIERKEPVYLSTFNYENKEAGFCKMSAAKPSAPEVIINEKAYFPGELLKAKKAGLLVWQKGSFDSSPELHFSDMEFGSVTKISVTNPQQSKYNWATAELVEWMAFDRQKLQGILYKPENFDPSRKYPMIVYFYERSSDGLYNYMPPAPSASIINRIFAASNGYLVFVPDIPYVIGYPGQSCYNSVVSGTYALLDRFSFIDKDRIGLDGQSWGGYQIAWLVTQTDLFSCAYAGAAVSDMISAYGGIRWGTGMSRMFQYEKTQSRIGGTLWEKPIQFVENSPIFFVPKINTPLLLMHNDADDAVPWYQSIEFITALRRLDKPAWLLSYNDEAHNLVKRPNRKDISIRKMQFFDHYLKNSPMPYWMKYGISQVEKGKKDGYELINE